MFAARAPRAAARIASPAQLSTAMERSYVAYGLRVRSVFALAGMTPGDGPGTLPELTLTLVTPAQMRSSWDGRRARLLWRGRLGDGRELAVEGGPLGDLLFSYGRRARFRLGPDRRLLQCAPARTGLDWQRVLLGKVLGNVSMLRGREALHASAVESPHGVVAILGPSGAGKSTLALELMRRGWPLFADDVLAMSARAKRVTAHPATPHLTVSEREATGVGHVKEANIRRLGSTLARFGDELWLSARMASRAPRRVSVLCLLDRAGSGRPEAQALPGNPLLLAPYMLGFRGDDERARRRFELYGELAASATTLRLSAHPGAPPAALAELLEEALPSRLTPVRPRTVLSRPRPAPAAPLEPLGSVA
jgi:hypothetical protein